MGFWGDDMLTVLAQGGARYEPALGWVGLLTGGGLSYVSPSMGGVMRLHVAGQTQIRERDLSNGFESLGGNNGLRGYASSALIGKHMVRINVEARTMPLYIWSVPVGMVAFWDAGDAFDDLNTFRLYQGVGVGLRWVLLQFNRQVYRLDWSFGLQNQVVFPGLVTFGFEQAF